MFDENNKLMFQSGKIKQLNNKISIQALVN